MKALSDSLKGTAEPSVNKRKAMEESFTFPHLSGLVLADIPIILIFRGQLPDDSLTMN